MGPNNLNIRPAIASDVDAVFAIRLKVTENRLTMAELATRGITKTAWFNWLENGTGVWVAETGGAVGARGIITGFAIALPKEATLWALFVDPEYAGQGIGSALLKTAEDWLFAQGCDEISLTTEANPKIRAHGFYERHGWILTGDADGGQVEYVKGSAAGMGLWADDMLDMPV
ncbi:GNAT family N-acetyltransferase [Thalassospira mesophila]|uniref:GNAT family N-acetyltransferase n=1 Tax=Thalassospira mesophila TaxID=1293891 RepID=UPI001302221D|nr:GNAT family N-acetyltransferase [Thalassospira mesophila]